jgi:hypothetical protein
MIKSRWRKHQCCDEAQNKEKINKTKIKNKNVFQKASTK